MYHKAYGIIETLAPLHVGASAGEETGNLNLIFRDQFTQTGIIPGSSIRGRFRADMRLQQPNGRKLANIWYGHDTEPDDEDTAPEQASSQTLPTNENTPTGEEETVPKSQKASSSKKQEDNLTTEALVKFEYASLLWLPVFCPGQPIVWVTCPRLLKRYKRITGMTESPPDVKAAKLSSNRTSLFFNLGFLTELVPTTSLAKWVPPGIPLDSLLVVDDNDIGIIHEMALYRQTRTKLKDNVKQVDNFFGFEALPEGSILVFPIAIKNDVKLDQNEKWKPFGNKLNTEGTRLDKELYFGGLESIGCGRCNVTLSGEYFK